MPVNISTNKLKVRSNGQYVGIDAIVDDVPVESGSDIGSVQTKTYEYNNYTYIQTASGRGAHAEGGITTASGNMSHAEGNSTIASGNMSHAEGTLTTASGASSHAEGNTTIASGKYSHSEGGNTIASGMMSHAEGYGATASGGGSHAEGKDTLSIGSLSHAEGEESIAFGYNSHAEGSSCLSLDGAAHSEGTYTVAGGKYTHSENNHTVAYGRNSHAENQGYGLNITLTGTEDSTTYTYTQDITPVVGDFITYKNMLRRILDVDAVNKQITVDVTFGQALSNYKTYLYKTYAYGEGSHVEGYGTTALSNQQHVQGKFNIPDGNSTYADIVGNGADIDNKSNAYALTWTGDGRYAGDVYVGCNSDSTGGTRVPHDVQVNGTSVVSNGVANIPVASPTTEGVIAVDSSISALYLWTHPLNGTKQLMLNAADASAIKDGMTATRPITPNHQHESTFYGLAKAAGDTTQSSSSNAVGTYTETAKSKIHDMLDAPVSVSGSTPSITAMAGVRYVCGEVSTLTIVVPASGCIDVVFESGSTPTVLTVTPPTGITIKWANGFDPTNLYANAVYEINILDGEYGVVGIWT